MIRMTIILTIVMTIILTITMTLMMTISIFQAVMSLYGGGQMTGVAVDSGQVNFSLTSIQYLIFLIRVVIDSGKVDSILN